MSRETQKLKVLNEVELLVKLFLETNASDIELSEKTGISSSTVGRRLINEDMIIEVFDKREIPGITNDTDKSYGEFIYDLVKKNRKANLLKGRSKGGKIGTMNLNLQRDEFGLFISNTKPLVNLSELYEDPQKQYTFLAHAILYFRLTLPTVSELLKIDENTLLQNLEKYKPSLKYAFEYLFVYEIPSQTNPRSNFLRFYMDLIKSKKKGDITEVKSLLEKIGDSKIKIIKEERKTEKGRRKKLDIEALINYELKYSIAAFGMSQMFHIGYSNYLKEVNLFLADKPDLRIRFENLEDSLGEIKLSSGGRK